MTNLISGKEALIALAKGEEVEFFHNNCWSWVGEMIVVKHFVNDAFEFRLKPRTITLNGIEVPAPFEPKLGETYYHLSSVFDKGYHWNDEFISIEDDFKYMQFGAWRTEDEIKQVVEALRKVFDIRQILTEDKFI